MPQRTFVETYLRLAAEMRRQIYTMPPSRERDLLIRIVADYDHVEEAIRLLSQGNVRGSSPSKTCLPLGSDGRCFFNARAAYE